MHSIHRLFDFVGPSAAESSVPFGPRRLLMAAEAFLAALCLAALWGLAAGSHPGHLALSNAVKVPMLLVVSSLAALPAGVVAFRLTARVGQATDIVVGHAAASFAGTLVLALLAPLVALYQYSSSWAGPAIALASAVLAVGAGGAVFLRVLGKLLPGPTARAGATPPIVLLVVLQIAALLQVASMTSPVFPSRTEFGRGVDAIAHAEARP